MYPVSLIGSQITLREFVDSDWTAMHQYAADPEIVKYELWGPNTEAQTREFLSLARSYQTQIPRKNYEFAVIHNSEQRLIGACGLRIKSEEHREGDIGYTLRKDQWGRGYGTEMAKLLIRFGFDQLKLHRIWATCHEQNLASARVLQKAGLHCEGLQRKNRLQRGEWRSSWLYAILEDDR